ncbi:MAG: hypothetical protein IT291_07870 [Deltaproteobacteria bacterium]|nr:hypothetical protein [Deltaproteobacteria bacterium]
MISDVNSASNVFTRGYHGRIIKCSCSASSASSATQQSSKASSVGGSGFNDLSALSNLLGQKIAEGGDIAKRLNQQPGVSSIPTVLAFVANKIPVVGPIISTVVKIFGDSVLGSIKFGKHADQIARDGVRELLQNCGVIDEKFQLELADGSKYDIGLDGGARYANVDGTERAPYQVDFSNTMSPEIISLIDPLTKMLFGTNEKIRVDVTGYLVNAALSNADNIDTAKANVLSIYNAFGISPEQAQT